MSASVVAISGNTNLYLPAWGRSFWQDPNDGNLFLAYISGEAQAAFITSSDSGNTWSAPTEAFPVDNFFIHNNFDTEMDEDGNIHCVYRFSGSGCYTVLAKTPTSWAPTGIAVREFVDVGDSGVAKGFNGMVAVYNTFSSDPSWWEGGFGEKSANIVVKDINDDVRHYRVPESGTFSSAPGTWHPGLRQGVPIPVFLFNDLPKINAGASGGFPVFTNAGGSFISIPAPSIAYSVNATGITYIARTSSFSSAYSVVNTFGIDKTVSTYFVGTVAGSGYEGRVPFNTNMSFGRSVSDSVHPILATIDNGNFFTGVELYSTAFENNIISAPGDNFFGRIDQSNPTVDGLGPFVTPPERDKYEIDFIGTLTQGGIPVPVEGVRSFFEPGTSTDISHGDAPGTHKIYFHSRDAAGQQVITRILCDTQNQASDPTATADGKTTRYIFSPLHHAISGIRNFAPAGLDYAGASGIVNWRGFKALRHPTAPGAGVTKKEIVATIGTSINPSTRLIIWDFDKSVEASTPLKTPTFSRFLTQNSGISPTFQLIEVFGPTFTGNKVEQLFDGDLTTDVAMRFGDGFVLEFEEPIMFSRAEFIRDFSSSIGVDVSGSLDNVNYFLGVAMDGGNALHKFSAEYDFPPPSPFSIDGGMDPFVAKYIRIFFNRTTGDRSITELRLLGPHTTIRETLTGHTSPTKTAIAFQNPPRVPYTEKFNSTVEGEIPLGWRTRGDWDWFVRASGAMSQTVFLPTSTPPQNGLVRDGIFAGSPNGKFDGFVMRTAEITPTGTSGILEIDINVQSNEIIEGGLDGGGTGRVVSFDLRYDLIGQGLLIPDGPEDDRIRFAIVPEGGSFPDGEVKAFHLNGNNGVGCFGGRCDWLPVKANVITPGKYTLTWMFKRGTSSSNNLNPERADDGPAAWIDNVVGLDGLINPSIGGFLQGVQFATGVINSYMNVAGWGVINAITKGFIWFPPRHGYMKGAPNAFSQIHGYILGNKEAQINAFTLGGGGLRSFPTGVIHGHIATNSGVIGPVINGYMLGMKQGQIHGYMKSVGEASGLINSYLDADYNFSTILGRLGPSGNAETEQVLGYLPARVFESVNAYLLNAGASESVFGFIPAQKSQEVFGYLQGPDPTGMPFAQVYGFMGASGFTSSVNAYMSGQSVFTPINGYLINAGAITQVHGYLNVQDNAEINGYMQGRDLTSEQVNAYMSGIGHIDTQVNGYMFGISGIADENVNGFMIGADVITEVVDAYIIGYEDACNSHGTVPLPTVPTGIIIPSTCFNDGV